MATIVEDLMSAKPLTLKETDDLGVARALLQHQRIRHLPVVREEHLVGLVTSQTLLRADAQLGPRLAAVQKVADVMVRDVHTVRRHTPARRAAKLLLTHQIGCLPVVEADGTLVGIVTDSDMVRFASDSARDLDEVTSAIFRGHEDG